MFFSIWCWHMLKWSPCLYFPETMKLLAKSCDPQCALEERTNAFPVEQFCTIWQKAFPVEQCHVKCGATCHCSTWKILLHMINVLTQYQIFRDKRTYVWSKNRPKILVCGAKMSIRPSWSALGMSYPIMRSLEILESKDSPAFSKFWRERKWRRGPIGPIQYGK